MLILNLAETFVVVVEQCSSLASNNNTRFATLSIFVPSFNLVYPSHVFNDNIAAEWKKDNLYVLDVHEVYEYLDKD